MVACLVLGLYTVSFSLMTCCNQALLIVVKEALRRERNSATASHMQKCEDVSEIFRA